jgi:cob(I)alamin adenosyltransferase
MTKARIYTRTGDEGDTGLFGGGRVPKADPRVEAYGAVDELNACVGSALSACEDATMRQRLGEVQPELFALGAHLATPPARPGRTAPKLPPLHPEWIGRMEGWMDEADDVLPELRAFIMPAGAPAAAALHLARTVCRRAERRVVALAMHEPVDGFIIVYLNRLSDLLFTLARLANHQAGVADVEWHPEPAA